MSNGNLDRNFLICGLVLDQPNIVEKIAGTVRRSPTLYQLIRLYYGPSGEDGKALFYVEVKSNEKNAERLVKLYEGYAEVLKVWWKEINLENFYNR
ncbi:MAG: hypothetical protein QXF28_04550 [Nitrososphaerota archaeon]